MARIGGETMSRDAAAPGSFVVDAHVHFHRPGLVAPTLRAALDNFSTVTGRVHGCAGALLLAQARHERVFEWLCAQRRADEWAFDSVADEPQTLMATTPDGRSVAIVNGRQVRADCGLEVLAIGTSECFDDGASFDAVLAQVSASDALPVIPWGFGKWTGRRGRLVRTTLARSDRRRLCVGDNGGRLQAWPEPRILRQARAAGFRILPGSDPFPFGGDYRRVGRFGLRLDIEPPAVGLWRAIRTQLTGDSPMPESYGTRLDPARFAFNNLGIQLTRRLSRGEP
jgi:hypothetical protein